MPAEANSVPRVAMCLLKRAWSPVLENCSYIATDTGQSEAM
jgi:hypothetical protein